MNVRSMCVVASSLLLLACGQRFVPGPAVIVDEDMPTTPTPDMTTTADMPQNPGMDMPAVEEMTRDPQGPEILELSVNPSTIGQNAQANVLATVTDPDGFADIGGGRLLTRDGQALSNFAGSGGSFQTTISWNELSGVVDLSFDDQLSVVLVAEFFDAMNNRSTREVILTLACDGGGPACQGQCGQILCGNSCQEAQGIERCNGACTPTEVDPMNCGMCGRMCGADEACSNGMCQAVGEPLASCEATGMCDGDGGQCTEFPLARQRVCLYLCDVDDDCLANERCVGGMGPVPDKFCVRRCQNDTECPTGQTCAEGDAFLTMFGFPPEGEFCFPLPM